MDNVTIIYPSYFRIFECRSGRWFIKNTDAFIGTNSIKNNDIASLFGISEQQVVIDLFRINGGKSGFYLANLKHKTYYYCGQSREDIKTQLRSLGIGCEDPMESQ
ncbi:hypothetical protein LC653_29095 [Nostoc sp. CHAB 5784]|uniref:hypothetical protein n=1 Tax=Nostoc mirabile TaxID=2907820 RepID=UPI001E577609|nr:hypothetical protein [Nostoc mirabile]MCC5667826.1 hypothetical protein [Nostoc mirabile CHAB5784]